MGQALDDAQLGLENPVAKALKGFGGRGVLEIVDDFDGDAYRAVYTIKFFGVVALEDILKSEAWHEVRCRRRAWSHSSIRAT